MSQKFAAIILSGFVGGIALRSFLDFGPALAGLFIFLGIIFLVLYFINHKSKFIILTAIFLVATSLGMLRYELKDFKTTNLREGNVNLEGIISGEPGERENYTQLILDSGGNKILIYADHYPQFHYGDKVKVIGFLRKPKNISDSFDFVSYLAKDDIYFEMAYPKIDFVSSGNGSLIKEKLFLLKENFISALGKVIPEPNSAFMSGITVGARKSIPQELQNEFRETGIIHIVVLSGYNVAIVADTITRLASFLPNIFGVSLGILGIILFAVMTGASAMIVRASLMAILVILARATGRLYQITWALLVTAFLMLLENPKILRFDTGFQISFLSVVALIYLAPILEQKFKFITEKFKLRGIISSTCSTQIFVLPLILYKMGIVSFVAVPVNLLILPFLPLTMLFGFLTGVSSFLIQILGVPFGWVAYLLTQYELWIVKLFAGLPFASAVINNFPLWLMLIIYAAYAIIILKINAGQNKKDAF